MIPVHTLSDMAADLGADVARDFADLYLAALDGRIHRLRRAIACADTAETHTAAVSLYTASWMVGAHDLADAAHAVAESARCGDLVAVCAGMPPIEARIDSSVADIRLAVSELGSVGIPHRAPSR